MAAPTQTAEMNHKKKKKRENQTNSECVKAEIKTEPVEEHHEDWLNSSTIQRNLKLEWSKVFSKEELNRDCSGLKSVYDDTFMVEGKHIHRKNKKKRKCDALDVIQSGKASPDENKPLSDENSCVGGMSQTENLSHKVKKKKKQARRSKESPEEILASKDNKSVVSFTTHSAKHKKRKQVYIDRFHDPVNDGQGKSKQVPNEARDLLNSSTDEFQGGSRASKSSCVESVDSKGCDSGEIGSQNDDSLEVRSNTYRNKKKTKRRAVVLDGIQSQEACPDNNEQVPNIDSFVNEITSPLLEIEHPSNKLKKKKKKKKGVRPSVEPPEEVIVRKENLSRHIVSLTTGSLKCKKRKQKHSDHYQDQLSDSEEKSKQVSKEDQDLLMNSSTDELQGGSRENKEMMNIREEYLQSESSEGVSGHVCNFSDVGSKHDNSSEVGRNTYRKKKKTQRRADVLDQIQSQEACPEENVLHSSAEDCFVGRSAFSQKTENHLNEPKKKKKKVKQEEPLEPIIVEMENRPAGSLIIDGENNKRRELNDHVKDPMNSDDQVRNPSKHVGNEDTDLANSNTDDLQEESRKQKRRKKIKEQNIQPSCLEGITCEVGESSGLGSQHDDSLKDEKHIRTKKKKKIRYVKHDGMQSQEKYPQENEVHEAATEQCYTYAEGSASPTTQTESKPYKIKKEKENMDELSPEEIFACEIDVKFHEKRQSEREGGTHDHHDSSHASHITLEMTGNDEKSHSKEKRYSQDNNLQDWNDESSSEHALDEPDAECEDDVQTSYLLKRSKKLHILGWRKLDTAEPLDNSWINDLPTVFDDEKTWGEGLPLNIEESTSDIKFVVKEGVILKKGRWTGLEDNILRENILNFCKRYGVMVPKMIVMPFLYGFPGPLMKFRHASKFLFRICKGLRRSPYSAYVRSRKIFDERNYKGAFTKEEEQKIEYYRKLYGKKWSKIGMEINRSGQSVLDWCRGIKTGMVKGRWTEEERTQLRQAILTVTGKKEGDEIKTLVGIPWREVHKMVPTRTIYQCHTQWHSYASWQVGNRSVHRWNIADSVSLIERIYELDANDECDIDWVELHKEFATRSPSPMRLHSSWSLLKKLHIANYLYKTYDEILDEMFHRVLPLLRIKIRPSMES